MNEANSAPPMDEATPQQKPEPTLKLNFISHDTLESKDLDFTRRFYERFLGFEVVRASKVSIWCRLGGQHVYSWSGRAATQGRDAISHPPSKTMLTNAIG